MGTLSSSAINLLLLPIYAYFVSAESLGEYDYFVSITGLLEPICFLCIWEAALKYCIKEENDREKWVSNLLAIQLLFTAISFLIFVVVSAIGFFSDFLVIILAFTVSQGWAHLWQYAARGFGENRSYVKAGVVGSASVVLVDCLLILFGELNEIGLVSSCIISQLAICFVLERRIKLFNFLKFSYISKDLMRIMIAFTLPLTVNSVALWTYSGGMRVLIRNYIGVVENGLYSYAAKFSVLISFCGTIISLAFIETVYSFKSLEEYRNKSARIISTISKAYFSMILLAMPSLYILYAIALKDTEYYSSSKYIFFLLLSAVLTALSNNYGSAFQITSTKLLAVSTIAGASIAYLISFFYVKQYGIYAILIASVVGPLVMMVFRAIYAWKTTGLIVGWTHNIVILVISVIETVILQGFDDIRLQLLLFLISIIIVSVFYKEQIIRFIHLRNKHE